MLRRQDKNRSLTRRPLPPTPKGRLLIGHGWEFSRDPLAFMTRCRAELGDIVRTQLLHLPVYLVSHPDFIEQVLADKHHEFIKHENFARAPMMP